MNEKWVRLLPDFIKSRIEGRHSLQNIISNTAWLYADNILRIVMGLLVGVVVTRYLGPEKLGALSYVISFTSLFSAVAMLGLDGIVVRNLINNHTKRDEIIGSAFALKFAGGFIAAACTFLSCYILHSDDHEMLLLVGITSIGLVFQSFGVIDFWFQSQVQSKYSSYARCGALLATSLLKLLLVYFHAPLTAIVWAGVAEIAIGCIGLILVYTTKVSPISDWQISRTMCKELLHDSWPLMFTDIVIFIYMRVDRIILGDLAGNSELGVYSVAATIAETLCFIPMALATSLFPALTALKDEPEIFFKRLQRYYNLMVFLAYAIAIPISLFSWWLIPFLYGAPFAKAAPMLVGLAWAGIFINLTIVRGSFLTVMNWTRLHFFTDFVGCASNILLNFMLIPRYGGMGAVIASVISYWLVAHGLCFLSKPLQKQGYMMTKAIFYPKIW